MAPPAYIFVVRHGNRLDVADKQWHLSSPTPYDPPLSYSGWVQSRSVGSRISDILRDRAAKDTEASPADQRRRRKLYRIVIHSSPFLRCIQTSIAISAGLLARPSLLAAAQRKLSPAQVSQLANAGGTQDPESKAQGKPRRTSVIGKKIVLRIDAFLGEWLSPTYFELITPPPGSVMMLASAKASLLKVEDYKNYQHLQHRAHSNSSASARPPSSHLWAGSPRPSPLSATPLSAVEDDSSSTPLGNLASLQISIPMNGDAQSPHEIGAYDPPVPGFSLSKNATIPAGYVNHAKDACVVVDYQWDSMRAPYDWGDGGELPEDWPDMHKRFQKGLQALVDWYAKEDDPTSAVTTEVRRPGATENEDGAGLEQPDGDGGVDVETVVILVSHGAGCNAMTGAITHKPALVDIPISSLTMAALKKPTATGAPNGAAAPTKTNGAVSLHQTYDLVLNASTDHLRSAAPTPNTPFSPSMANLYGGGAGVARGRSSNSFSTPSGNGGSPSSSRTDGLNRSSSINGSLASIRRSLQSQGTTRGLGISSVNSPTHTPSGLSVGLWSPPPPSHHDSVVEEEDDVLPYEKPSKARTPTTPSTGTPAVPAKKNGGHAGSTLVTERVRQQGELVKLPSNVSPVGSNNTGAGLWGPGGTSLPPLPPAVDEAEPLRDQSSHKRRWTVTERS